MATLDGLSSPAALNGEPVFGTPLELNSLKLLEV